MICNAETGGYDGLYGVYCMLPAGHAGFHRDEGGVIWCCADELEDMEARISAEHDRYRATLERIAALPWSTAAHGRAQWLARLSLHPELEQGPYPVPEPK